VVLLGLIIYFKSTTEGLEGHLSCRKYYIKHSATERSTETNKRLHYWDYWERVRWSERSPAPFRSRKVRNSCRSALPPTRSLSAADISGNSGLSATVDGRCRGCSGNKDPSGACRRRSKSLSCAADATTDNDGRLDGGRGNSGMELSSSSVVGCRTTSRLDAALWPITAHMNREITTTILSRKLSANNGGGAPWPSKNKELRAGTARPTCEKYLPSECCYQARNLN